MRLPPAWDIAVHDEYAFVCDYEKFLTVYHITDRRWVLTAKLDMPSMTENVVLRDGFAYVANHTAGLTIVDVSKPAEPSIVGNFNPRIDCDAISLWQDCAVLYGHWESRLILVDVSDRNKLRQTGLYQHSPKTFNQGELAMDEGIAYCTALTGLVIVDVRDQAAPKLLKDLKLSAGTTDVVVIGGYAFLAAGPAGILVYDVRNPSSPVRVGCYETRNTLVATQIAVRQTPGNNASSEYIVYVANKRGAALVLRFRPDESGDGI